MRPSPTRLEHYHLTEISLTPKEDYTPEFDDGLYPKFSEAEFSIGVRLGEPESDDEQRFLVHLDLAGKPKEGGKFPYAFTISADAIVEHRSNETNMEVIRDMALVNGASMLYSALREVLMSLTCRFPNGPMMLPSANFNELRQAGKAPTNPLPEPDAP